MVALTGGAGTVDCRDADGTAVVGATSAHGAGGGNGHDSDPTAAIAILRRRQLRVTSSTTADLQSRCVSRQYWQVGTP